MKKPKAKTIACHVNPSDYPVSRLEREHLALLKCINDTPIIRNNCIGEKPEPGKYYLAISSGVQNSFGVYLNEEPRYIACTLKEDNRTRYGKENGPLLGSLEPTEMGRSKSSADG